MNRLAYILLALLSTMLNRIEGWLVRFAATIPQVTPKYGGDERLMPPEHWLEHIRPQPPAHWLEYIQSRAPHLLDSGFEHYVSQDVKSHRPMQFHEYSRQHPRQMRSLQHREKHLLWQQRTVPPPLQRSVGIESYSHVSGRSKPAKPDIHLMEQGQTSRSSRPQQSAIRPHFPVNVTWRAEKPVEDKRRSADQTRCAAMLQPPSQATRPANCDHRDVESSASTPRESHRRPQPTLLQHVAVGRSLSPRTQTMEDTAEASTQTVAGPPQTNTRIWRNTHQAGTHLRGSPSAVREVVTHIPRTQPSPEVEGGRWAALIEEDDTSILNSITQTFLQVADEHHEQRLDKEQRGSLWNGWPF